MAICQKLAMINNHLILIPSDKQSGTILKSSGKQILTNSILTNKLSFPAVVIQLLESFSTARSWLSQPQDKRIQVKFSKILH
jgi:hypothetical protein